MNTKKEIDRNASLKKLSSYIKKYNECNPDKDRIKFNQANLAKQIFCIYCSYHNAGKIENYTFYTSTKSLGFLIGCSVDTIERYLARLIKAKIFSKRKVKYKQLNFMKPKFALVFNSEIVLFKVENQITHVDNSVDNTIDSTNYVDNL